MRRRLPSGRRRAGAPAVAAARSRLQQILTCLDAPGEQDLSAQQGEREEGKELFQLLDPLILRYGGCLLLSLSKYEECKPLVRCI